MLILNPLQQVVAHLGFVLSIVPAGLSAQAIPVESPSSATQLKIIKYIFHKILHYYIDSNKLIKNNDVSLLLTNTVNRIIKFQKTCVLF